MLISLTLSGEQTMYRSSKFNKFLFSLPQLKIFSSEMYLQKNTKLRIFVRSFYLEDCGRYRLRNIDSHLRNYQTANLNRCKYRHGYIIARKPKF